MHSCIVEQVLKFAAVSSTTYIAKSVHIARGKQETIKEAQVRNESMKT